MKITVIGTGHVGLVSGACLVDLGNDVFCLDVDERKVALLRSGGIPGAAQPRAPHRDGRTLVTDPAR